DEFRHPDDRIEVARRESLGSEGLPEEPGQAVDEIPRLDLTAVMEADPLVQVENVGEPVARDGPALGDLGNGLEIGGEPDEGAENLRDDDRGIGVGSEGRVQSAGPLVEIPEHLGLRWSPGTGLVRAVGSETPPVP